MKDKISIGDVLVPEAGGAGLGEGAQIGGVAGFTVFFQPLRFDPAAAERGLAVFQRDALYHAVAVEPGVTRIRCETRIGSVLYEYAVEVSGDFSDDRHVAGCDLLHDRRIEAGQIGISLLSRCMPVGHLAIPLFRRSARDLCGEHGVKLKYATRRKYGKYPRRGPVCIKLRGAPPKSL